MSRFPRKDSTAIASFIAPLRDRLLAIIRRKARKANPVSNGHVIMLPHDCDKRQHRDDDTGCPVCHWGLGVCMNCNAAEVELEEPCKKVPFDWKADFAAKLAAYEQELAVYNDQVFDKAKLVCLQYPPCSDCRMRARADLVLEQVFAPVKPHNPDPVHFEDGGWWFYEETWADRHGPFLSESETRAHLKVYVETFLDPKPQVA